MKVSTTNNKTGKRAEM